MLTISVACIYERKQNRLGYKSLQNLAPYLLRRVGSPIDSCFLQIPRPTRQVRNRTTALLLLSFPQLTLLLTKLLLPLYTGHTLMRQSSLLSASCNHQHAPTRPSRSAAFRYNAVFYGQGIFDPESRRMPELLSSCSHKKGLHVVAVHHPTDRQVARGCILSAFRGGRGNWHPFPFQH